MAHWKTWLYMARSLISRVQYTHFQLPVAGSGLPAKFYPLQGLRNRGFLHFLHIL